MSEGDVRVLIVDDDPQFAKAAARQFRQAGCSVSISEDGAELERFAAGNVPTDGIALDVDLGLLRRTGLDLLAALRERRVWVPTLVVTGLRDIEPLLNRAQELHAQFCTKPLVKRRVDAFVAWMLRERVRNLDDEAVFKNGVFALQREIERSFTPCELGLIAALFRGMKQRDYARSIGRDVHTIESHAKTIREKTRLTLPLVITRIRQLGLASVAAA